ncbi:MAG: DUF2784 domain-containing protein [Gammaproteobacteria bacterium]|nr:DUF2784 domain-containing protein [Gammaproteobacteria bacterium]
MRGENHALGECSLLLKILADLTLVLHLAFILFALFGGFLVLYKNWVAWLHVPALIWASIINLTPWFCPLTPLENWFRVLAGEKGYEGGFIEHYIMPIVYPGFVPKSIVFIASMAVILWNILVYGFVIFRIMRRPVKH